MASWLEAFARSHWLTGGTVRAAEAEGAADVARWFKGRGGLGVALGATAMGTASLYYGMRGFRRHPESSGATGGAVGGGVIGGLGATAYLASRRGLPMKALKYAFTEAPVEAKAATWQVLRRSILRPNWGKIAMGAGAGAGIGGAGGYFYGRSFRRKGGASYVPAAMAGSMVGGSAAMGYMALGKRGALANTAMRIPGAMAAMAGAYGFTMLRSNRERL